MRNSEEKIFIMCLLTEEKQKKEKDREKILCAKVCRGKESFIGDSDRYARRRLFSLIFPINFYCCTVHFDNI